MAGIIPDVISWYNVGVDFEQNFGSQFRGN